MPGSKDRVGGYTLEQLLGAAPVSTVEKKQGLVSKVVGAPFRLAFALIKLPFTVTARIVGGVVRAIGELLKLPVRLLGALAGPWKKKQQ